MKRLTLLVAAFGLSFGAFAQDDKDDTHTITVEIPEVALLSIEGTKDFTATFIAPTVAGEPIEAPADNTALWLNWSSIVTSTGADATRAIKVKLSSLVPGVDIFVLPGAVSTGFGTPGTPVGAPVKIETADKDIFTGVGSCYTESGTSKGSNLTYSFVANTSNYAQLANATTAPVVTVTYTLTDN